MNGKLLEWEIKVSHERKTLDNQRNWPAWFEYRNILYRDAAYYIWDRIAFIEQIK